MLVLTRRKGESILIGDGVEVRLLGLNSKEARIGIQAPRGVAVDRREFREKQRQESAETARESGGDGDEAL